MDFLNIILTSGILITVMTYFSWATNKRIDDAKNETNRKMDDIKNETNRRIDEINKKLDDAKNETNRRLEDTKNETNRRLEDAKNETNRRIEDINKRMDDTREAINQRFNDFKESMTGLLESKIRPLQEQVENHIPSAIKQVKEDQDKLKENQKAMQKDIQTILQLVKNLSQK